MAADTHELQSITMLDEVFRLITACPGVEYLTVEYYKKNRKIDKCD